MADLQTADRVLASEIAGFQSRRLSQQSMGYPVLGLLRRRPRFCELLTDMRPLVSVTLYTMWFEHPKCYVQMFDCRLYEVEPDEIYCWRLDGDMECYVGPHLLVTLIAVGVSTGKR